MTVYPGRFKQFPPHDENHEGVFKFWNGNEKDFLDTRDWCRDQFGLMGDRWTMIFTDYLAVIFIRNLYDSAAFKIRWC